MLIQAHQLGGQLFVEDLGFRRLRIFCICFFFSSADACDTGIHIRQLLGDLTQIMVQRVALCGSCGQRLRKRIALCLQLLQLFGRRGELGIQSSDLSAQAVVSIRHICQLTVQALDLSVDAFQLHRQRFVLSLGRFKLLDFAEQAFALSGQLSDAAVDPLDLFRGGREFFGQGGVFRNQAVHFFRDDGDAFLQRYVISADLRELALERLILFGNGVLFTFGIGQRFLQRSHLLGQGVAARSDL